MRRSWLLSALTVFTLSAFAQSEGILNKLLAPGPLVKGHANLEGTDCLKCHDAGKGVPDSQCLSCHKEIRFYVENKRSFHGLTTQSCRECHSDHKGRDYDSLKVDEKNFDHGGLTGYSLDGKHEKLKCEKCHNVKYDSKYTESGHTRYSGKQATCVSCHRKDDIHFFKGTYANKDCSSCHDPRSWKEFIKFDHEKDGHFKLVGKHAEIKCADCHGPSKKVRNVQYKWPNLAKTECLACHADFHQNNLSPKFKGGKCQTCHNQTTWKIDKFNHDVTKYKLGGKHAEIKCVDCHKPKEGQKPALSKNLNYAGLKTYCLSCHKDFHLFGPHTMKSYGLLNQCSQCHNDRSWKQIHNFEHNTNTRYIIDGKHEELKCNACHAPEKLKLKVGIYHWPQLTQKNCESCHKSPHTNEFSKEFLKKRCDECHVTSSWITLRNGKGLDHNKTRFPLTGAHVQTKCSDCHGVRPKQVFKFATVALKFCVDCHLNIHKNQFSSRLNSNDCVQCHTTKDFKERLVFDHAKTRYPLEGAHQKVKCEECHKPATGTWTLMPPNTKRAKSPHGVEFQPSQFLFPNFKGENCLSCHADYHKRQLDEKCLKCHTMDTWKISRFDHSKQTSYELKGKHIDVKCSACHKPIVGQSVTIHERTVALIRYKPIDTQCLTCHKDPHKGSFGNQCIDCHMERDWKITRDFHKNFTLTGVHYGLECSECHKDGRKLAGLSQQCIACHAKDDVHSGTLPRCEECHRQQFWEVSSFRHSLTRFPLRGAHRTIDCMQCHQNGTYKGLSSTCSTCHLQEAIAATSFVHSPIGTFMDCTRCHHNQFSFRQL